MKHNMKRTLAIIGVVFLVCLYVFTFIFALTDSSMTMGFFKASLYSTIVIPVLLYAYILIYKYFNNKN